MSGFYVKKFNRENKCPQCQRARLVRGSKTYSICATHLEKARVGWMSWAARRRGEGRCCYCDRKSYNGYIRCRSHTLSNREKCRAWGAAHPERGHEDYLLRLRFYAAHGLCLKCKDHNKAVAGTQTCQPCKDRRRLLKADSRVFVAGRPVRGRGLRA
jgi:hypothetical protein